MKKYFLIVLIIIVSFFIFLPKILPAKNENQTKENYQPTKKEEAAVANQTESKIVFNQRAEAPIFLFHHIRPFDKNLSQAELDLTVWQNIFEEQLKFFNQNGFHSVSLEELYDYFYPHTQNSQGMNKEIRPESHSLELGVGVYQGKPLPAKPFILTFDDGYEDFYQVVWPLLQKYQTKATIFVITGLVNQPGYLTWSQIEELAKSDLIEFGAHTIDHKYLSLSPPSLTFYRLSQEIFGPKTELEKRTGRKIDFFSYPYGFYNQQILDLVKEAKYAGAVTTDGGVWQEAEKIYELKRLRLSNSDTAGNLNYRLKGLLSVHYFNSESNF